VHRHAHEEIIQFFERSSGTFDLHWDIANSDAFIRTASSARQMRKSFMPGLHQQPRKRS
jgi:hypothetical protein